jgi:hypothetical protein
VITGRYHEFNLLINLLDKEFGFFFGFKIKMKLLEHKQKSCFHQGKTKGQGHGFEHFPSMPERERIGIKQ